MSLLVRADLLARAAELAGLKGKSALVQAGLEALIEKKSRERLAALGGSEPRLRPPVRRRF